MAAPVRKSLPCPTAGVPCPLGAEPARSLWLAGVLVVLGVAGMIAALWGQAREIDRQEQHLSVMHAAVLRKERLIVGLSRRMGLDDGEIRRLAETPVPWEGGGDDVGDRP